MREVGDLRDWIELELGACVQIGASVGRIVGSAGAGGARWIVWSVCARSFICVVIPWPLRPL